MVACLMLTAGVALLAAIVPVFSVDVFVVAMAVDHPHLSGISLAVAAATGQMVGRLAYFLAARGQIALPQALVRRTERWSECSGRGFAPWAAIQRGVRRLLRAAQRHQLWSAATLAVSSFAGLPPVMVSTLWFGRAGMPTVIFVGVALPTRIARFLLLANAPDLFTAFFV